MNLKTIKQITFAEKKLLVTEACLMYSKLKLLNDRQRETKGRVADIIKEGILTNAKSYSVMESIFNLLDGELSMIIQNDFVERENKNWYLENWSKSTYYRLKHEAVDQFLFLLYA